MNKRKVCVVVTARPSYSRIRSALYAIQQHSSLELQMVVTSSALLDRYGKAINVIKNDGFVPDATVFNVLEGEDPRSMAKTTGLGIIELSSVFDSLKPDVVVSIADRYETMATAIAASYMNIPLCHVQGGEVTGSIDEKVRHSISKLSDLHLVSNEHAKERLIKMGEEPSSIHVTGCPSIDIAAEAVSVDFDPLEIIKKYHSLGDAVSFSNEYQVVMQHPVTTEYEEARQQITTTLEAVEASGIPTLWFWPNVDAGADGTSKGIRTFREQGRGHNIRYFKNMEPVDFLRVLKGSKGIIGNSSVAVRECAYLGVPAVNIGSRQQGRDRGANVSDVEYDEEEILKAIRNHAERTALSTDLLYGDGKSGVLIADVLSSAILTFQKCLTY